MKTNKSYIKRLKVTKNGKIVSRKAGQNHFNAKESRKSQHKKKRSVLIHFKSRITRRFLSGRF